MQDWIKQNVWTLVITLVAISMAWATINARVNAVENGQTEIEERLVEIQELTTRLIVLEESQKYTREVIDDIQGDVKDLKKHFEIQ